MVRQLAARGNTEHGKEGGVAGSLGKQVREGRLIRRDRIGVEGGGGEEVWVGM